MQIVPSAETATYRSACFPENCKAYRQAPRCSDPLNRCGNGNRVDVIWDSKFSIGRKLGVPK